LHRKIDPDNGFDLMLRLDEVAKCYRAMERRAIKVLLRLQ